MREIWVESGLELFYIWSEGGVGEFLDSLRDGHLRKFLLLVLERKHLDREFV